MPENLFETQYDLTKKSKVRLFYENNKILIFSLIGFLIFIVISYSFYQHNKEKKKILLSERYIEAKIFLENKKKVEALQVLKDIVFSNNSTYSTLSFFLIMNENLINDSDEVAKLFDYLLENNKFDNEIKNLLLYKRALYKSNYVDESILLEEIKPLLNNDKTVWKAHALLLLGDFYFSKEELLKAKDFYTQVLLIKNLQKDFYKHANSKLALIADE